MTEPTYPDALPAQYRLHWYVLERVLGQGGFGITYLARDTNLDQLVAIKEYLPVDVATRRADSTVRARSDDQHERYRWGLERFIREARTLARFDHPNVVRVLSVFEHNNTAYMVMRFEEGENFAALLERRRTLPEAELLRVLLPIIDGLALVHNAGFIHRDIKPDNIHIRADGTPVLLDFGSARLALGQARTVTILVAPGYAPFEQYYSTGETQGPWTDIYGLGATCYRAIAGIAPMDAIARSKGKLGSTQEILVPASAIGQGRYSARLLSAIDHALEFSEKDRPQTLGEWRHELTDTSRPAAPAASSGGKTASVPAGDAPRAPARPAVAQGARSLMTGAIAGAVVTVAAVWLYLQGGEKERLAKELERSEQVRRDLLAQQDELKRREEDARKKLVEEERGKREAKEKAEAAAKTAAAEPTKKETPPPEAKSVPKPAPKPVEPRAVAVRKTEPEHAPEKKPAPAPEPRNRLPETAAAVPAPVVAGEPAPRPAAAPVTPVVAKSDPSPSPAPAAVTSSQGAQGDAGAAKDKPDTNTLAHRGDIAAQFRLAENYEAGRGVPQNYNQAYIWYSAAARGGHALAKAKREQIAAKLQPAEIKQADRVVESLTRQAK